MNAHKRESLTIIWATLIAKDILNYLSFTYVHRKLSDVVAFKQQDLENKLDVQIIICI